MLLRRASGKRDRSAWIHRGVVVAAVLLLSPLRIAGAQPTAIPAERLAAREWFRQAGFGMFIHWGVYSQLGAGEWVMQNKEIPAATYEWLASEFNPIKFDAHEWVSLAKAAGARYITITSRHHDGFSMFATKATPYNIVDWTPFKRDPIKELAEECQRQGIKLFFYYSQLDWHHPDYFPRGRTGKASGRPESGDWTRYVAFMNQQLTELLTNYGPIGGIWFDGMWDKPDADWHLADTYGLIHRLQPAALIVPNHHGAPLPGEDVQTFEQDLPGANTAGFNTTTIGTLPLETSLTMNDSWGFNITDNHIGSRFRKSSGISCAPPVATPTFSSTSGRVRTARFSPRPHNASAQWVSGCRSMAPRSTTPTPVPSRRAHGV